jgi:type IV pilus assembly protein PilM
MAKRSSGKDNRAVGIDIGSYSVKAAVMNGSRENPFLEAYNIRNIPSIAEKTDIAKEVKVTLEEIDVKPNSVNLSVFGPEVIVRFITLPKMTKEQLNAALIFEAEKYIPFNIREVVLDSIVLGDAQDQGQMKVLLAAAKRGYIESLAGIFSDLGIQVNFVDVTAFAGFNAFMASSQVTSEKVVALLEIGHSQTTLLISIDGAPFFVRQIHIGGKDVDLLVAKTLSVTAEKASEYKKGVGDFDREDVNACLKKVLDGIIREIQLSFGYFEGTCNRHIEGIYCSGGMTYTPGALEYLSEKIGSDIKKWDPLRGMKISDNLSRQDLDSVSSSLAVSVGLAIRGG